MANSPGVIWLSWATSDFQISQNPKKKIQTQGEFSFCVQGKRGATIMLQQPPRGPPLGEQQPQQPQERKNEKKDHPVPRAIPKTVIPPKEEKGKEKEKEKEKENGHVDTGRTDDPTPSAFLRLSSSSGRVTAVPPGVNHSELFEAYNELQRLARE